MPVVIDQLAHTPEAPGSETRGTPNGNAAGAGELSRAATEAQVLAALRREASRQARLWAD